MVQAILGLPEPPQPDDAADALAIAIWTANRERAGERMNAGILDRAAAAPRSSGETPYERAVREALAREERMLEEWDGTAWSRGAARNARPGARRSPGAALTDRAG
jgi:hypothetical protein